MLDGRVIENRSERVESPSESCSASSVKIKCIETQMLQVAEDRLAEGLKEDLKPGVADEVLGECAPLTHRFFS